VWRQVEPFASRGRVVAEGPAVTLRPEAAQATAMALHELATNAAKYGALSAAEGKVAITWRRHAANGTETRLEVLWRESGGPPVRPPEHRGFGYTVVHDVVKQMLQAEVELDYATEGVNWRVLVPVRFLVGPGAHTGDRASN
jgi:two-component sensor histidine kinase